MTFQKRINTLWAGWESAAWGCLNVVAKKKRDVLVKVMVTKAEISKAG